MAITGETTLSEVAKSLPASIRAANLAACSVTGNFERKGTGPDTRAVPRIDRRRRP